MARRPRKHTHETTFSANLVPRKFSEKSFGLRWPTREKLKFFTIELLQLDYNPILKILGIKKRLNCIRVINNRPIEKITELIKIILKL
jgi:hypothetical protein